MMKPVIQNLRKFPTNLWLRTFAMVSLVAGSTAYAEQAEPDEVAKPPAVDIGNREEIKLPGLKILTKQRQIDVDATVCLEAGFLELIVCTKGTKEHESIIMIDAKPSHLHAALLLLGARPGNPAMMKELEGGGFADIPPNGGEVDVYLAFKDDKGEMRERPISDFIMGGQTEDVYGPNAVEKKPEEREKFPTHTFLFAGSQVYKDENGKSSYVCDGSGNVVSLSTFGDEVLCLPGKHSQDNSALSWEINPTHLPPLGTKVTLRLRPKLDAKPEPAEETEKPKQ